MWGGLACPCLRLPSLGKRDLSCSGNVSLQDTDATLWDTGAAKGAQCVLTADLAPGDMDGDSEGVKKR